MNGLHITAARPASWLLTMPWQVPLSDWSTEVISQLPRGISRHVVRYVEVDGNILALKEITDSIALHEYHTLRRMNRLGLPCVESVAVVSGRVDAQDQELPAILITRHLQFSMPYRTLVTQKMPPSRLDRVLASLAVLLVRLHIAGVYWGDVSLSNTLFRRDAGEYAGYFVDAETARVYDSLTEGQRVYDLDLARVNIIGELMDLQAGGVLSPDYDVIEMGDRVVAHYNSLWHDLTGEQLISADSRYLIDQRLRRLNQLGFDVGELSIDSVGDTRTLRVQPRVVEGGHYKRLLHNLTGLLVEEKQAQRLLNDIETFRALQGADQDLQGAARRWLNQVFGPAIAQIPPSLRSKLEPAQAYHEILEHRWYMSEQAGASVSTQDAAADYVATVLVKHPDEQHVIS